MIYLGSWRTIAGLALVFHHTKSHVVYLCRKTPLLTRHVSNCWKILVFFSRQTTAIVDHGKVAAKIHCTAEKSKVVDSRFSTKIFTTLHFDF